MNNTQIQWLWMFIQVCTFSCVSKQGDNPQYPTSVVVLIAYHRCIVWGVTWHPFNEGVMGLLLKSCENSFNRIFILNGVYTFLRDRKQWHPLISRPAMELLNNVQLRHWELNKMASNCTRHCHVRFIDWKMFYIVETTWWCLSWWPDSQ